MYTYIHIYSEYPNNILQPDFHQWDPFIAGWSISWKIPNKTMDDNFGHSQSFRKSPYIIR